MRQFKDLGIKTPERGFTGDKIKMNKVINKSIIVHAYKIEDSKFEKGNGKCLHMQIEVGGTRHLLFSGSTILMETIKNVPDDAFPFATTIVMENERLQFT
jgi:hypothetical protein